MKYYAGLDVSLAETAICILDEDGIIVREGTAISDPNDIADWLQQLGIALASRLGGGHDCSLALQRAQATGPTRHLH